MPVVTIKIDESMFKKLKKRYPYHGDISRVIRNAIRAINKGIEFTPKGNIIRINNIPMMGISISVFLSLIESIDDDEKIKKIAVKNADSINESFYINGIHSKEAVNTLFFTFELANIINYKWVEQEDQWNQVLIYVEKTIYPPRIQKLYFNELIKYFCKLNRLSIDVSGTDSAPIYRIHTQDGSVLI
ncbi:MAG: hypothetical protein ACTSWY_10065 [Promethearchaeota archaeon]